MSLYLTKSQNIQTKGWKTTVDIGQYQIDMDDFCQLVLYVLDNSDCIGPEDPRHVMVETIRSAKLIPGYGPNLVRYSLQR